MRRFDEITTRVLGEIKTPAVPIARHPDHRHVGRSSGVSQRTLLQCG
jgi:hypothetical protein